MKLQSICPTLYRPAYFQYVANKQSYPKLSLEKSQYAYHIIAVEAGTFDVTVNGSTARVEAGDLLYLLPGDVYRILPCGLDFSLYNLFFDLRDSCTEHDNRYTNCVFLQSFQPQLCLPRVEFEDACVLNQSGIFPKINVFEKNLKSLLSLNRADATYPLRARAMLLSVIADMVSSAQGNKATNTAQRILEYIRCNPENDLSGNALSALFSYHKNHINKLIKHETGKSLSDYIRYSKIEHAKTLMLEQGCSLSEISTRLGYFDYSHFYKAFHKETGIIPTEYLKLSGLH